MRVYFLLLLLLLPGWIIGTTHIVKLDGSGDFTSIQAAINASASGDTVLAYPGTYHENLTIQINNLSLYSLEAINSDPSYIDSTVINANMISTALSIGLNVQNIAVRGFSFTNGKGTGVAIGQSSVVLSNCKIFGCIGRNGGGLIIAGSPVTLSGVEVYSNYALNHGGGLYAAAATNYQNNIVFDPIHRCSIYNNRSGAGQDIYIQNAESDLNVYLDTFSVADPTTYYAIYLSAGLTVYQMSMDILNAHHQEINCDLYVSPDGDDTNDGLSPITALRTIHEGVYRIASDSLHQNTVRILPGTYSRTANDQVFPVALKSWTIVQGSGIDTTTVIGEPHPTITAGYGGYDAVFRTDSQANITLSDMTITTINTDNDSVLSGYDQGNMNLSNLRIHNVHPNLVSTIWVWLRSNNHSTWDNIIIEDIVTSGSGLVSVNEAVANGGMSGKISNCTFRNAISTFSSASVWADALVGIRGNRDLTIENCEFSNLTMTDNDSYAIALGGVQFPQQHNNFSFSNCLFDNISSPGGIIGTGSSNYPSISFTNCTFADNEGNTNTLMVNGNVNITNCIFDNETPYQIKVNSMTGFYEPTTLSIDYSCVKDGLAGIQQAAGNMINYAGTNTDSDPLFRGGNDPSDPQNYSLTELSPCVNSGAEDITGLNLPPFDLAGNWRVWNGRIDMGCYEYGSEPWVVYDDPVAPDIPPVLFVAYPNPFTSITNLQVILPPYQAITLQRVTAASIDIYNIKGQKIKSISLDPSKASEHFTSWDGRDDCGRQCSSGIYLLNLSVNGIRCLSKKVTLFR